MTRQRQEVYRTLMQQRNHPTANDVFMRVKDRLPNISLATVYNCLEALVQHGIIRQVNFERESSRYCPNLEDHAHFHCESCGHISDITIHDPLALQAALTLPAGSQVHRTEIALRGHCPVCASTAQAPNN